ncbi:MAG: hypothetical protein WC364_14400 [Eubacteriales bacterium]|jgi:hypothetical protein
MTMQTYLSIVSQFVFSAAVTIFLISLLVVISYYCFKMAQGLILKRDKIVTKVKKAIAFPPAKPELVSVKKASAK